MSTHVRVTEQRVNTLAVRFALVRLRQIRAAHAAYEEEVRAWYASGDGRSPNWRVEFTESGEPYQWNAGGRGYAFPACIHGASRWTDYDNICGPCEDSLTMHQEALYAGHRDAHAFLDRMSVVQYATDQHVPQSIVDDLTEWAMSMLDGTVAKPTPRRLP